MYLDVHGLAFETSIYNRKDQSGICISAFPKMQVVATSEILLLSAANEIRLTERQPYRVAEMPTLA